MHLFHAISSPTYTGDLLRNYYFFIAQRWRFTAPIEHVYTNTENCKYYSNLSARIIFWLPFEFESYKSKGIYSFTLKFGQ